ncbi:MAG: bifunctional diguanylate cyclase/phosphodiesterase [Lachnospiraceae bacterium]|nr:bifunctional diguanylate cyclase/phosphodiesterase [Lachnospiraceae bacterium]
MVKENGKQKMNKGILLTCIVLWIVSSVAFIYLFRMRHELIEEQKAELLRDARQSEQVVSNSIVAKFDALETIQDLISQTYDIGPEAAQSMESSRVRYGMAYLGLIDADYIYYGSNGTVTEGVSQSHVDLGLAGEKTLVRGSSEGSSDGVAFSIPYTRNGEIVGVLCSKYLLRDFVESLGTKVEDAAQVLVNAQGQEILESDGFSEYMGGLSWNDIVANSNEWKNKEKFDRTIALEHSGVASAKNRFGDTVYFAVVELSGYEDLYVVRFINTESMEAEIQHSMFWVYVLLVLMIGSIVCIIVCALINYSSNRKEVYKAAYVDPLTGLPSKTKHKLDAQALIDKQDRKYAYVTFDIDNFKYINEMFGYEHGNLILIHIANVVKNFIKEKELCARVSADNFALLLLDEKGQEDLTKRIKELFDAINEFKTEGKEHNLCTLKFSCGVYRIEKAKDINKVRANANLARSESKKRMFTEVVYYDETLRARRIEERELEFDAEAALENGEFLVYFQPKYDVGTEKIIGAEALIRWNHSKRGMLSPGLFIPLFEANGFVIELDMFVLEKVCELISAWITAGIQPVCISVNLSRTHLYERDLVKRLVSIVNKYDVPRKYIEFELTESAFYEEMETLLRVMEDIKKEGFRLSMDDFGSGYSSLNLLRQLPVDVLKLDREFLGDCGENAEGERGKRIVTHVISMAKDLEMSVLAEGVETQNQKEFLRGANCDMIQGYYYAKPMPTADFEVLYMSQKES